MWWHTVTHGKGSEGEKYRMQMVASTLHTTAEHAVSNITTADLHVSAASSRLNLRPPADLNVVVLLATKMKSVFCACAIIFETHSTACSRLGVEARQSAHVHCCLQAVSSMCVGTCRHRIWRHNFLLNVKNPGLFTQWQTQCHITSDYHCHLPVAYGGFWGVQIPPKFWRPNKIMSNSTRFLKNATNCWI